MPELPSHPDRVEGERVESERVASKQRAPRRWLAWTAVGVLIFGSLIALHLSGAFGLGGH